MAGTKLSGVIEKVTDGDTLRITADNRLFKVRVLGLDTEESNSNPHKPVTQWGKAATNFTKSILPIGTPVEIEFPGTEEVIINDQINTRYLDNFQRPLGFVNLITPVDGITDFSELMIRKGYSPYFVKYGRAIFAEKDQRYTAAEIKAQEDDIGVWNQLASNDVSKPEHAPRNYARLMVWWELRARIIDEYRQAKQNNDTLELYNTRLDYDTLQEKANQQETVTVFMELREGKTVGGTHHVISSGSYAQPFDLFLPNEDDESIIKLKQFLKNRYIADGEDFPRRNYAYITGKIQRYNQKLQMIVESLEQISDHPPQA